MRALTIRQPWASLIAVGAKTIETRSWSTSYRGPLLIHAGIHYVDNAETYALCQHLFKDDEPGVWKVPCDPPMARGAVVASCLLTDVVPIVAADEAERADLAGLPYPRVETSVGEGEFPDGWLDLWHPTLGDSMDPEGSGRSIPFEAPFGDFSPGRYAWLLSDVKPTTSACPRCWGTGALEDVPSGDCWPGWKPGEECATCEGLGHCPPVPVRGKQGLWTPVWSA